jgi:hypothetical protein
MDEKIPNVLFAILAIGLVVAGFAWHFSRSKALLKQWASENGFELLHSEYRNFFKGPFFWTTSRGQTVYYVQVSDSAGNVRSGWVRCGSWWMGLMSDKTEVRWEDV